MGNPNEPRLMKPRHDDEGVFDGASGNAALDGFTRLARRRPPGTDTGDDLPMSFYGGSDDIQPQVGERDWNRGPRFSED